MIRHLVGVASILALCDAAPPVVAAGLVHAAYGLGERGEDGGASQPRRSVIRDGLGKDVERLVDRVTAMAWTRQSIPAVRRRLDEFTQLGGEVVLIRLAKELEAELDLGTARPAGGRSLSAACRMICLELSAELGYPDLRAALEIAFTEPMIATTDSMV